MDENIGMEKCATDSVFGAMTSNFMMANHAFILLLIVASFVITIFAFQKLWKHNVFSTCARALIWSSLANGLIHQFNMAVIRVKALSRAMSYTVDACSILFHSSECFIEIYVYYTTSFFSFFCLFSLFLDRIQSFRLRSCYHSFQITYFLIFSIYQSVSSWLLVFWILSDHQFDGYVPMCYYPPPSVYPKFYFWAALRLFLLFGLFIASLFMIYLNNRREKKIVHKVFDTESRYKSYENLMTTRAVCLIIFVQIACSMFSSGGVSILHRLEPVIPEYIFHTLVAFMGGLTYTNFFLPIVICHQTNLIIQLRHKAIGCLQKQTTDQFSDYFGSLDKTWERIHFRDSKTVY